MFGSQRTRSRRDKHTGDVRTVNPLSVERKRFPFSCWDLLALLLVLGVVTLLAAGSRGVFGSLQELASTPISLDPRMLPQYAA